MTSDLRAHDPSYDGVIWYRVSDADLPALRDAFRADLVAALRDAFPAAVVGWAPDGTAAITVTLPDGRAARLWEPNVFWDARPLAAVLASAVAHVARELYGEEPL